MKNLNVVLTLTLILMSVFNPDVRCEVGNLRPFSEINQVQVTSSWKNLTDVATIDMPKNVVVRQDNQTLTELNDHIKKGDRVIISTGYSPNMNMEFQGFVRSVSKNVPLRIECEDYMYLLKLDAHTFSLKEPTLKDIVNKVLTGDNIDQMRADGYDFDVSITDTEPLYDQFTARSATGAQILQQIKDELPFAAYFTIDPEGNNKPQLIVGYRPGYGSYTADESNLKPVLRFGTNVPKNGWNLTYQNEDDVKVKIKAISNLKSGKKLIVEVGDPTGEVHTRNYPPITKDQLTQYANEELRNFKRNGLDGQVMAFGEPFIKHGDTVIIDDPIYTKETRRVIVDETVLTITEKPTIRRKVVPGLNV
ncbi:hypothetical protein [Reichenbachiella sp.]|uniref:hypothetical protein n=1 Tax=Reichenbachiella sp. TaxID=2184521 RepID=UPI003B58C9FD